MILMRKEVIPRRYNFHRSGFTSTLWKKKKDKRRSFRDWSGVVEDTCGCLERLKVEDRGKDRECQLEILGILAS